MLEGAVRDHADAIGRHARLVDEALAAVRGVRDHEVGALIDPALRRALPGSRLARQDVVGRDDERAAARECQLVELLDRRPLDVREVGRAGAQASQAGRVLAARASWRQRPCRLALWR